MPKLSAKNGAWDLPHVHEWKDRQRDLRVTPTPLVDEGTRVFMMGTCVAVWIAAALRRAGYKSVSTHPDGHLMNTRSMRQVVDAAFGGWPQRELEPIWKTAKGFVDPFAKSHTEVLPSEAEIASRRANRDAKAKKLIEEAEVFVIVPEYADTWFSRATGNAVIGIPLPDVFDPAKHELRRLTVEEMKIDLRAIIARLRALPNGGPKIILATGGFTEHASLLNDEDVRVASYASMARTRAALSELCDEDPTLHYFALADTIRTAERPIEFVEEDGRHYHKLAIDYFAHEFVRQFGKPGAARPPADPSWLSGPGDVAASRPVIVTAPPPSASQRIRGELQRSIRRSIPTRYLRGPFKRLIDLV